MPESVLVTGGAGFIGSFLVDALLRQGNHVIVYDNLDPQVHRDGLPPSYANPAAEFIQADIRDRARLESAVQRADVISHQGALVGVGQSMYQVERYVDVNVRGTALLLDILVNAKHHVRKLVVPGSMSAYGEGRYLCSVCGLVSPPPRTESQLLGGEWELTCERCSSRLQPMPTDEGKPLQPTSVYALAKQHQEQLVLNVCQAFGIPATVLRYFNVLGPRQSLDNPYTGVAAIFLSRLKNDHAPLVFEDGLQSRDFISVHDIVDANLTMMRDSRSDFRVFNVGAGRRVTILELARELARLLGKNIEPVIVGKFRRGDIRHCSADITRLVNTVDWAPRVSLEAALHELIEWSETVSAYDRIDTATEELRQRGLLIG